MVWVGRSITDPKSCYGQGHLSLKQRQCQEVAALPEHQEVPVSKHTKFLFKTTQIPTAHFLTFLGRFLLGVWSVLGRCILIRLKDYLVKISVSTYSGIQSSPQQLHCRFPSLKKLMDFLPFLCCFTLTWRVVG